MQPDKTKCYPQRPITTLWPASSKMLRTSRGSPPPNSGTLSLHTVLEIPTGPPVRGRQLWRRTGNFSLIFLWFYVYDLRFKTWGPTTFLTEFPTLITHGEELQDSEGGCRVLECHIRHHKAAGMSWCSQANILHRKGKMWWLIEICINCVVHPSFDEYHELSVD